MRRWFEGEMRVLAEFQINLAIPKCIYGYISTRGREYVYRGVIIIVLVGEGKIDRELHSRVSSQHDNDEKKR